jgi:hypothetical protein
MAKAYRLPVTDTVIKAWKQVNGAKSTFWFGILTLFVIVFIGAHLERYFLNNDMRTALITTIVIVNVINLLFSAGLIHLGILRSKGEDIEYKMVFYAFNLEVLLYLIGLIILQTLIIFIPTAGIVLGTTMLVSSSRVLQLLGILLGMVSTVGIIYLAVHMMLSLGFILDKKIQPFAAIKKSFATTKNNFWRLATYGYMISVLMLAGMMMFVIGIVWTLPLWYIAYGAVYHEMSSNNN